MFRQLLPTLLLILITASSALTQLTFNRNGQFARSYGTNGFAEMGVGSNYNTAAFGKDGSIITATDKRVGQNPSTTMNVYKQLADGTMDASFGQGGLSSISFSVLVSPQAIALQQDGKILVGGGINTVGNDWDLLLVRLLADGTLDQSYGIGAKLVVNIPDQSGKPGAVTKDHVSSIVVLPDGRAIVSGVSSQRDVGIFPNKEVLLGVLPDGVLDPSFGTAGIRTLVPDTRNWTTEDVQLRSIEIKLRRDGNILAFATLDKIGLLPPDHQSRAYVLGFHTDGSLDTAFGVNGMRDMGAGDSGAGNFINDCIELMSGKIVCSTEFGLNGLNSDGTDDPTFGLGGGVVNDGSVFNRLFEMPDGTVVVSGSQTSYVSNTPKSAGQLRRFLASGALDARFGSAGRSYLLLPGQDVDLGVMNIDSSGSLVTMGRRYVSSTYYLFTSRISLERKL